MIKMNKAILGAIAAGIVGIFFATVGFLRTIMIMFLVTLGYLIGSYFETRMKE
ncbi:MAG: DUF2273 domain-containing protein [candidate division WOR-3 bacterium]|nr:MAG: DUF2273 domain-containing protein [candidate division WOR-3 bacterium]